GLEASVYEVRSGAELEARFAAAARDGMQALSVPEAPLFLTRRSEIAAAAASVRLPAIYTFREFVQAGGLMSYGADLPALYQRAAGYVDKILKGAKSAELPLQSSEKFELAVNLKTAKALNLTISEAFLLRADEVIECGAAHSSRCSAERRWRGRSQRKRSSRESCRPLGSWARPRLQPGANGSPLLCNDCATSVGSRVVPSRSSIAGRRDATSGSSRSLPSSSS